MQALPRISEILWDNQNRVHLVVIQLDYVSCWRSCKLCNRMEIYGVTKKATNLSLEVDTKYLRLRLESSLLVISVRHLKLVFFTKLEI